MFSGNSINRDRGIMSKNEDDGNDVENVKAAEGEIDSKQLEDGRRSIITASNDRQHLEAFLENLNDLRLKGQLCDVEIECQGSVLLAHKVVLAASIDYFRGLYNFGQIDAHQRRIVLQEVTYSGLSQLVDFAYTADVNVTDSNVRPLLVAANYLGVKFVKDGCEDFLISLINRDNCLELRELAEQQSCAKLSSAIDTFIWKHFMELCNSNDFLQLSAFILDPLIQTDDLNIPDEKYLVEFILKWVSQDEHSRIVHLPKLLRQVRFSQLPLPYFIGFIRQHPLIAKSKESLELIHFETENFLNLLSENTLSHTPKRFSSCEGVSLSAGSAIPPSLNNGVGCFTLTSASSLPSFCFPHSNAQTDLLPIPETLFKQKSRPRKAYAGLIFCVGGRGPKLDPFRSVEVYDWLNNKWKQIGQFRIGRRHVGVICIGPRIYAIGGHDGTEHLSSVECLDMRDESWCEVEPLNVRRRGMAVGSLGAAIYAIGGLDDQNCYKTVERYDIELNQWTHVAEMNVPRGGVAVATYENCLYAIGGNSGTTSLGSCERYDPILDKWTPIEAMKNRRAGAGVAVIGSYLYVIGGFDDDAPLSTCERYSFADNIWTEMPPLSSARGGVGVAAMGGRIFAIGGHDSRFYLNTVEMFDPQTSNWVDVAPINQRRAGAGVAWSPCAIKDVAFPNDSCI